MNKSSFKFPRMISALAVVLILLSGLVPIPSHAADVHVHATAGFSVAIPDGWAARAMPMGLELAKGRARITVDNLEIREGRTEDVMAILTSPSRNWNPTVKQEAAINKPFPGRRVALQNKDVLAEMVVLKTPQGYFMASLEPSTPADKPAFESLLGSFAVLGAANMLPAGGLPQIVSLGPVEVAMPAGQLELQPGFAFWQSKASGTLTVELVKRSKAQPLTALLGPWEKQFLGEKTGLQSLTASHALRLVNSDAVVADYQGSNMLGRVQVIALGTDQAIRIALVTRKESFASHQALLDAIAFSAIPGSSGKATSSLTAKPAAAAKKETKTLSRTPAEASKVEPPAARPVAPVQQPAPQSEKPPSKPAEGAAEEKSLLKKFSESIKQGADKAACSDAQRSMNQCR